MFEKHISKLFHEKPTIENIQKNIAISFDMLLGSDYYAKDRWEIEVFQKKPELKTQLEERLEKDLAEVLESRDIYKAFRELIVDTVQVAVVNGQLTNGEHADSDVEVICRSINRGIALSMDNEQLRLATQLANVSEAYSGYDWCRAKAVHESAWAEMKLHILRTLQIQIFERVSGKSDGPDWWDVYREAYTIYIKSLYKLILDGGDEHRGFPHPIVAAMGNDALSDMREKLFASAVTP